MKPAAFEYVRADSVPHAVTALAAAEGEGKIIAGGQSLMPMLALRLAQPAVLIDINRIPGLEAIWPQPGGGLRAGALVRHRTLAAHDQYPLLAEAARWIGHPAIRTRGTLGGSLAHADPAGELPVVAMATGAAVIVTGPDGQRRVPAAELFAGALQTDLADDELIEAVEFPALGRWGFAEFARRHGDFGLVIVAFAEVAGRLQLAVGGVSGTPVRPAGAEHVLAAGPLTRSRSAEAAAAAAAEVQPAGDIHATTGYRRQLTQVLVTRALEQATATRQAA
jgi:carbon-monoxide dehydrogenase medium subunit